MPQSIRTKWLPATNTKGQRVVATATGAGNKARAVVGWDWSLSPLGNHQAAAIRFAAAMNWAGDWRPVDDGALGYLFVNRDALDAYEGFTSTEDAR